MIAYYRFDNVFIIFLKAQLPDVNSCHYIQSIHNLIVAFPIRSHIFT